MVSKILIFSSYKPNDNFRGNPLSNNILIRLCAMLIHKYNLVDLVFIMFQSKLSINFVLYCLIIKSYLGILYIFFILFMELGGFRIKE